MNFGAFVRLLLILTSGHDSLESALIFLLLSDEYYHSIPLKIPAEGHSQLTARDTRVREITLFILKHDIPPNVKVTFAPLTGRAGSSARRLDWDPKITS